MEKVVVENSLCVGDRTVHGGGRRRGMKCGGRNNKQGGSVDGAYPGREKGGSIEVGVL